MNTFGLIGWLFAIFSSYLFYEKEKQMQGLRVRNRIERQGAADAIERLRLRETTLVKLLENSIDHESMLINAFGVALQLLRELPQKKSNRKEKGLLKIITQPQTKQAN